MTTFRNQICERFHANSRISRQTIFGVKDPVPLNLVDDARTMFAGAVGRNYQPGGVVLLAINPGGGGDAYVRRTVADETLYPLLQRFRDAGESAAVTDAFEEINSLFLPSLRSWNVWRIMQPCLEAAGVDLSQAAYMNAVPYRTRKDRTPSVAAKRAAWQMVTSPALDVLQPRMIIALGMKAGDVLKRFYSGPAKGLVVPRTIGDTYVSQGAEEVLARMRAASVA